MSLTPRSQHDCHLRCVVSSGWVLRWSPDIVSPLISTADYKFDLLYSKRAFVHWYVGEGMEEVREPVFPMHSLY